jgi:hypothetical protein
MSSYRIVEEAIGEEGEEENHNQEGEEGELEEEDDFGNNGFSEVDSSLLLYDREEEGSGLLLHDGQRFGGFAGDSSSFFDTFEGELANHGHFPSSNNYDPRNPNEKRLKNILVCFIFLSALLPPSLISSHSLSLSSSSSSTSSTSSSSSSSSSLPFQNSEIEQGAKLLEELEVQLTEKLELSKLLLPYVSDIPGLAASPLLTQLTHLLQEQDQKDQLFLELTRKVTVCEQMIGTLSEEKREKEESIKILVEEIAQSEVNYMSIEESNLELKTNYERISNELRITSGRTTISSPCLLSPFFSFSSFVVLLSSSSLWFFSSPLLMSPPPSFQLLLLLSYLYCLSPTCLRTPPTSTTRTATKRR